MPTYPIPQRDHLQGERMKGMCIFQHHCRDCHEREQFMTAVLSLGRRLTPHGHFKVLTLKIYKLWMKFVDNECCLLYRRQQLWINDVQFLIQYCFHTWWANIHIVGLCLKIPRSLIYHLLPRCAPTEASNKDLINSHRKKSLLLRGYCKVLSKCWSHGWFCFTLKHSVLGSSGYISYCRCGVGKLVLIVLIFR